MENVYNFHYKVNLSSIYQNHLLAYLHKKNIDLGLYLKTY